MRSIKKTAKSILAATAICGSLFWATGCGDSTSNDNGVAFTFLGWFIEVDQQIVPVSSSATPLSGDSTGSSDLEIANPGFVSAPRLLAGLKNGLIGQFIRTERLFFSYHVPGASVNPPDSSVSIPGTLFPASDGVETDLPSTLPDSFDVDGAEAAAGAEAAVANYLFKSASLIPPAVREYMVLNKSQFPEPPFVLVVSAFAEGVTSAGQRIQSNSIEFDIVVEPDVIIAPTAGVEDSTLEGELEVSDDTGSEEVFQ